MFGCQDRLEKVDKKDQMSVFIDVQVVVLFGFSLI